MLPLFAERLAYMPLVGACGLAGLLLWRARAPVWLGPALLVILLAGAIAAAAVTQAVPIGLLGTLTPALLRAHRSALGGTAVARPFRMSAREGADPAAVRGAEVARALPDPG